MMSSNRVFIKQSYQMDGSNIKSIGYRTEDNEAHSTYTTPYVQVDAGTYVGLSKIRLNDFLKGSNHFLSMTNAYDQVRIKSVRIKIEANEGPYHIGKIYGAFDRSGFDTSVTETSMDVLQRVRSYTSFREVNVQEKGSSLYLYIDMKGRNGTYSWMDTKKVGNFGMLLIGATLTQNNSSQQPYVLQNMMSTVTFECEFRGNRYDATLPMVPANIIL